MIIRTAATLHDWYETAPGRYLRDWEEAQFEQAVADAFGYHALQIGSLRVNALRANRMPHRWLALDAGAHPSLGECRLGHDLSLGTQPHTTGERAAAAGQEAATVAAHDEQNPAAPTPSARPDQAAPADAARPSPVDAADSGQTDEITAQSQQAADEPACPANLVFDARALPFFEESLDLVVLPHTLEFSADPHACLREVARVLVNEGRVVISGINPLSLWGARQWRGHAWRRLGGGDLYLPAQGEFISPWRLADWLRLLGFVVGPVHYGCWRASARTQRGMERLAWMDRWGERLWPVLGAAYCVTAVKRTAGATLMGKPWREVPRAAEVRVAAPRAPAPQSSALKRDDSLD